MRVAALTSFLVLTACGPAMAERPPTSAAVLPRAAPAIFVSVDKNLTFPTPPGSTYCPLAEDWVGSDHGTTVFLTPPDRCGGGGAYASSERGALNAPNIQVFYGYDVLDAGETPPPGPCEAIDRLVVLGHDRPLCLTRDGDRVEVRVETPYRAEGADTDIDAEAVFTLVTSSGRLQADLATFRQMLGGTGTCNRTDTEGRPSYPNQRPDCPADAVWF